MKGILLSFALMLSFLASIAQSNGEHLDFRGVPIDGSLDEYVSEMKSAGFAYLGDKDGIAVMRGEFAGIKGCIVGISTNSGKVSSVSVLFPEDNEWSSLELRYNHLKTMLSKKYGNPTECIEDFNGYKVLDDNSSRLRSQKVDNCIYISTFETPAGYIRLSLDHQGMGSCYAKIQYLDKINMGSAISGHNK